MLDRLENVEKRFEELDESSAVDIATDIEQHTK